MAKIEYKDNTSAAKVIMVDGSIIEASRVIVTVPIQILKDGLIEFQPSLPKLKQEAINGIGIERDGVKLVLKCKKRFWPAKLSGMICADVYVPELWFREYGDGTFTVSAFGVGKCWT